MSLRRRSTQAALALGVLAPASAHANMGLPMIAVFLPPLWVALVPIVVLEAMVVAKRTGASFGRSIGGLALANIASTIVGVPVLWALLAIAQLVCCGTALGLGSAWTKLYAVTIQAPWLIPYQSEFGWMVPSALCTLAAIFVVMSVAIETPIVSRIAKVQSERIWSSMWIANIVSYLALGLAGVAMTFLGIKLDPLQRAFMPLSEIVVEGVFAIAGLFVKGGP
jgi:hypothetical protein